jgi:hypothetical protein
MGGEQSGDRSNNDQDTNNYNDNSAYYDTNTNTNANTDTNTNTNTNLKPEPVVIIEDTYEVKIAKIKAKILNNQALTQQESGLYKGFMDNEDTTIANYSSMIAQRDATIQQDEETIKKRDAQLIQEWKDEETSKLNTIVQYNEQIVSTALKEISTMYDDIITLINTNKQITDELNNLDITILHRISVDNNYEKVKEEAVQLLGRLPLNAIDNKEMPPMAQALIENNKQQITEYIDKFMTDKKWFMDWIKFALSMNDETIDKYKTDIANVNKTDVGTMYQSLTNYEYQVMEAMHQVKSFYMLARESQVKANDLLNQLKFDVKDANQVQTYRYVYDSVSAENKSIDKAIWNNGPGTVLKDKKAFNQLTENERVDGINSRLFIAYWFLFFVLLGIDIFLHNANVNANVNANAGSGVWSMIPKYIILLLFPFIIGPFEGLLWSIGKRVNDTAFLSL